MVWAPRCALRPLGSVRGEEGLNVWESIAFAEACENRYRSGDDEREEEARFLFEEALAAEQEAQECNEDEEEWEEEGEDGDYS
jgi:hypothetical protein